MLNFQLKDSQESFDFEILTYLKKIHGLWKGLLTKSEYQSVLFKAESSSTKMTLPWHIYGDKQKVFIDKQLY